LAAVALCALGLAQMAGDLAGVAPLRGIAAATGASPAPKVFSAVQGLETYSTRFYIEGGGERFELTPELASRMRGPYNRRNVYGAALAYAPVIPPALRDPVVLRAFCGPNPLLRELGFDWSAGAGPFAIELEPLAGVDLGDMPARFTVSCGTRVVAPQSP
jgi:hypothetical protein